MSSVNAIRDAIRLSVSLSVLMAVLLLEVPRAQAGADGLDFYGGFCQKDICVPAGYFGYEIIGKGNFVGAVTGYGLAPRVCNWHMTFSFYDANGRRVKNFVQPTQWNCKSRPTVTRKINQSLPNGRSCARLYINRVHRSTVCHSINP